MTERPLLSVVMPVKNGGAFLAQALESIAPAFGDSAIPHELVVADGGSTDRTLDILAAFPSARVVSTVDAGIYDGLNRAIAATRGEYVAWLNADDLLAPAGLARALSLTARDPSLEMVSGHAEFLSPDYPPRTRLQRHPLTVEGALFGIPALNTRLFRRSLLVAAGPVRTDLGLAADREFLVRLSRRRVRSAALGAVFYRYRSHPGSATLAGDMSTRKNLWRAEAMLADSMAAEWRADDTTAAVAARRRAFAALRLKVGAILVGEASQTVSRGGVVDALRGTLAHLKWRSALSGA